MGCLLDLHVLDLHTGLPILTSVPLGASSSRWGEIIDRQTGPHLWAPATNEEGPADFRGWWTDRFEDLERLVSVARENRLLLDVELWERPDCVLGLLRVAVAEGHRYRYVVELL